MTTDISLNIMRIFIGYKINEIRSDKKKKKNNRLFLHNFI